jgi:hypothetical protein
LQAHPAIARRAQKKYHHYVFISLKLYLGHPVRIGQN